MGHRTPLDTTCRARQRLVRRGVQSGGFRAPATEGRLDRLGYRWNAVAIVVPSLRAKLMLIRPELETTGCRFSECQPAPEICYDCLHCIMSINQRRYLAFDLEIARILPGDFDDWHSYRPLGISCAATFSGEGQPRLWHGRTSSGEIAERMSQAEASALLDYLQDAAAQGYTLLTWNGVGFDFDILAEESGRYADCRALALEHVDMMFHIFCQLGYALGLDTAARGMGLTGKTPGMRAAQAPIFWAAGRYWEVLQYVAQDVRTTFDLARAAEARGALAWINHTGTRQTLPLPEGWLAVQQALSLPEPDTSWMRRPWPRTRFTGWLQD